MTPESDSRTQTPAHSRSNGDRGPWSIPATLLGELCSPLYTKAKVCPTCAERLSADANFCPIDGSALYRLSESKTNPLSRPSREQSLPRLPRRKMPRQMLFVALLLAAFGTCAFALQLKREAPRHVIAALDLSPAIAPPTVQPTKPVAKREKRRRTKKRAHRKNRRAVVSKTPRLAVKAKGLALDKEPRVKADASKIDSEVDAAEKRQRAERLFGGHSSTKPYHDLDEELNSQRSGRSASDLAI